MDICTQFAMHGLHVDEKATLQAMSGTNVRLLPTHGINEDNQLEGFRMELAPSDPGSNVCIHRSMFFGHSIYTNVWFRTS